MVGCDGFRTARRLKTAWCNRERTVPIGPLTLHVSHGDELSRYALSVSESPVTSGDEIADHQVIIRGGQIEAIVVPLEEYRALKALEQREAELYWAVHEARYPSRPGDDMPDGKVYDSMDALLADLSSDG